MWKTLRIPFCILGFAIFFVLGAHAQSIYRDDFAYVANAPERIYSNFRRYVHPANPAAAYGTFGVGADSAGGYNASVTYNISGVRDIRLGIYSDRGTRLGFGPQTGRMLGAHGDTVPAYYAIGADGRAGVFDWSGGEQFNILTWDDKLFNFVFTQAASPPTNIKYYGVNVYANGQRVMLTQTSSSYFAHPTEKHYEEFYALIPRGATGITVEINDVTMLAPNPQQAVGIAFVEFTLEEVTTPMPELELLPPPQSSSSSVSSRPASLRASSVSSQNSSRAFAPPPPSSSGYFVGSPMPPVGSRDPGSAPPQASSRGSSAPPRTQSAAQSEPQTNSDAVAVIYRTERQTGRNTPLAVGAILFIALSCGGLAVIFLRGKKG